MNRKKILIAIFVLAVFSIYFIDDQGFLNIAKIKRENSQMAKEIERLKVENEKIKNDVKKINTDPQFQIKTARERLSMQMSNETIYITMPEKK